MTPYIGDVVTNGYGLLHIGVHEETMNPETALLEATNVLSQVFTYILQ